MKLTQFAVDDGPHNSDGLLLHGWDEDQQVTGFISRRVMDDWVDPRQPYRGRKSLYREQYNAGGRQLRTPGHGFRAARSWSTGLRAGR
jgi:hypothetical protein